ncbi:MAG: hypothetical protein IPK78_16880 [Rhodospirillales bacterium]|nr:hypothetical protein [Rhodospirillales bacterium]
MTIRSIMPFGSVLLVTLVAACGGGSSSGGGTTPAVAAPSTPVAQAPAVLPKGLPTVNTSAAQALLSSDQVLQTVDFPESGSKTVSGRIEGYKSTAYAVPAKAGQTLTVAMTTSSTSAYFNVRDVRDQSGAAIHRGEIDGPKATISVPADTTYLIDPFLVRAVARRGSTADYTLTITRQ